MNSFEYSIYELKRNLQEKEEQLNDADKIIERLKEKTKIYKEQSDNIRLETTTHETMSKNTADIAVNNVQKYIEIQQELFHEKREIYKVFF